MSTRSVSTSAKIPESKLKRPEPPVSKLALGILLQALRDVTAPKESSREDSEVWRDDAVEWFTASGNGPGSLNWVCQILEMNPGGFRRWLTDYHSSEEFQRREWSKKLTRFHIPH
ncbi:MAG TPA: hypothetical protein VLU25_16425 [Acidobacteriota bacterium]|nr:hypothetical protein [Acidobacteriota bacterium]